MPGGIALATGGEEPRVGGRLRTLRHLRGLTIEQVASATGLTKGFISQLERDMATPSLSSLARICDALGVRMGDVFHAPARDDVSLIRKSEREPVEWNASHFLLTPPNDRRLQAIESHLAPGESAGDELYSFPGDVELVYVLKGALELQVHDETYTLHAGDALTYPLREPHSWRNASDSKPAHVLWVAAPNPYASEPA